jgi:hypothetical protein
MTLSSVMTQCEENCLLLLGPKCSMSCGLSSKVNWMVTLNVMYF